MKYHLNTHKENRNGNVNCNEFWRIIRVKFWTIITGKDVTFNKIHRQPERACITNTMQLRI